MRKALITGWTKWIGYAIAERLAKEWYELVLTYLHDQSHAINMQQFLSATYSVRVTILKADSWSRSDIADIFKTENNFTVLVNNIWSAFPDDTWIDRQNMFQYHVMWTVHATEYFAEQLWTEWSIINITSVAWSHPGAWHKCMRLEAYCCMKAAVEMYTKICANKYKGKIWVNAVSPGNTMTPWRDDTDPMFIKSRAENSCIRRFINPSEIAEAAAALIANKWINGQVVTVDWGEVARWYEF